MRSVEPIGTTRVLNKPKDWDDSKGDCGALAISDLPTAYGNIMMSEWMPSVEELKRIIAGAPVRLFVVGEVHPPVSVEVGEP